MLFFGKKMNAGASQGSLREGASNLAVQVQDLHKDYEVGAGMLPVIRGISFSIRKGEVVGVTGESGSGKSTLLHLLGALDTPTKGSLIVGGTNPFGGSDREVSLFRNRHIGFVFQHNNLLPEFSALENVMMPGLIAGHAEKTVRQRAAQLFQQVGLEHRKDHYPGQMSGGEQQRVAIARALINEPVLLLADEPSGNLDSQNASRIHTLFLELNRTLGTTVLVVTHNMEFARSLPRRLEMRDGQIVGDFKPV